MVMCHVLCTYRGQRTSTWNGPSVPPGTADRWIPNTPILKSYLQVSQILRRAVQTPPTPPQHPPLDRGKLLSSLPRVHTQSLPRLNPPPLPRVPASIPHQYPTSHTRHNQPRPVVATAAAVIDTITGSKYYLQTL